MRREIERSRLARAGANRIFTAFGDYERSFKAITARARQSAKSRALRV